MFREWRVRGIFPLEIRFFSDCILMRIYMTLDFSGRGRGTPLFRVETVENQEGKEGVKERAGKGGEGT